MATSKSVVTEAELNVLKVLWDEAPLSARQISERLYPELNPSTIGTVQKLIARLEGKKMLVRDDTQTPHLLEAVPSRDEIAGMQLDDLANKLSGGSLSPFVMHLVRSRKLSRTEKREIRRLLED
ncbi:MAG: BlaI/MecI/CopY family transcriptional regulator [Verrucomicrobiota bacterium]